jgi:branched-chain amino acid transport system substrate-binding protein
LSSNPSPSNSLLSGKVAMRGEMKSNYWKKTVWLGLAMMLSLTACGSSSPSTPGTPFVLGAVLPLTGVYAGSGHALLVGLEAGVADVNSAGGVLGRQVKLVTRDSASDPSKALLAANDLLSSEHPDVVYPDAVSTLAATIVPVTTTAKILTLSAAQSASFNDPIKYPYHFQMAVSTAQQIPALLAATRLLGGSSAKLGILSSTDAAGVQQAKLLETGSNAAGIPFVGTQFFTSGAADLTVQLAKLRTAGAIVVQCHCPGLTDIATAMKGVQSIGWKEARLVADESVGGGSNLDTDIPADVKSQFAAIVPRADARTGTAPPTSKFVKSVIKLGQVASLLVPANTYDAVVVWKWAADKAGSVNSDKVKATLETMGTIPDSQLPPDLISTLGFNPHYGPTQHGWGSADLTHYWTLIKPSPLIDGTYQGTPFDLP